MSDAVGGQLQIVAVTLPAGLPFVRQGRLRGLAVMSRDRSPNAPDIPAMRESGIPQLKDFAVENYYGFLAPGATPPAITQKVAADIRTVMQNEELVKKLAAAGMDRFLLTPQQTTEILRSDIERYKRVARIAGIKQE